MTVRPFRDIKRRKTKVIKVGDVKIVVNGAGASAMACANLFIKLGVEKKNLIKAIFSG